MLPPNKPTKTKLLSANSKLDSISYRRDRARPCPQKNHILNQIHGQPQGLSLWGCVNFNIISTVNYHISMTINGGSKPPPYRAKVNLWVLQSLRVAYGNPPPFTQRRLKCGCPYGLWVYFNMVFSRKLSYFSTIYDGGSKPPTYAV